MGSVIKKRLKKMAKHKHRKMLKRTRVQRRKLGSAEGGDDGKPHDYILDWQDGCLIELLTR